MVDHGVKRYQTEKAYSAVHTEEHQHVERQRRELLAKLTGAGLSQDQLVRELGNRLAARVTIGQGPTGPARPAWGGGPLPGVGPSDAAALAKLISGWRPRRQTAAMAPKLAAVGIERDGQTLKLQVNGRTIAIEPGQSALGRTYGEWLEIAKRRS
jgi:hypothetical protein